MRMADRHKRVSGLRVLWMLAIASVTEALEDGRGHRCAFVGSALAGGATGSTVRGLDVMRRRHLAARTMSVAQRHGASRAAMVATPLAEALLQPQYEALNAASSYILRAGVWMDFRLAVAFFVASPLLLLAASIFEPDDAPRRILFGYWQACHVICACAHARVPLRADLCVSPVESTRRVHAESRIAQASSLLLITVLLNIGEVPISTLTGFSANLAIASSLLWWEDLNAEIAASETQMARLIRMWRPVALATAAASAALQIPFLHCTALPPSGATNLPMLEHPMLADPACAAALEPPTALFAMLKPLLPPVTQQQVASLGLLGLGFYVTYLAYYVSVPLRTAGREGRKERGSWSILDPLLSLGWVSEQHPAGEEKSEIQYEEVEKMVLISLWTWTTPQVRGAVCGSPSFLSCWLSVYLPLTSTKLRSRK